MGTRRHCRRSLRRISRIRAMSGGDIVQRSELLLCSHVPCAGGEAVHGDVSGVCQSYMAIFTPAFREFHERILSAFHDYQGHAHSALTGMWGAQSTDHSDFFCSCTSSFALTYVWGALQHRLLQHQLLSHLAKHTYGSSKTAFGHTLMISHFKSSSFFSTLHRRSAAGWHYL